MKVNARQRLLGHAHLEKPGRSLQPSAQKLQEAVEELAEMREKMPVLPENFLEEMRAECAKEQEDL